jgi:hypothetical protein
MKTLLLACLCLCSCSFPVHLADVYYPNGQIAKREFDSNPSIGGVHSQKGADGYQVDDDNQQSLRDFVTAAGTAYGLQQSRITTVQTTNSNNAKAVATQPPTILTNTGPTGGTQQTAVFNPAASSFFTAHH